MERAPLRPVPDRPAGPVSEPEAVARVSAALPGLGEHERVALALAAVAGTERGQIALRLGLEERELSEVLARARKQLRRTVAPLSGSGWCERAEALISDRIDDALAERDEPRLNAHLRNCPRCVEHERRLVQATDALLEGVAPAPSAPALAPPAKPDDAAADPAPDPDRGHPVLGPDTPASALPARADSPEASAERRGWLDLVSAVGWNVLLAVAIVLALAALALALAGALGAQL
jgi:Putative zinc-finger